MLTTFIILYFSNNSAFTFYFKVATIPYNHCIWRWWKFGDEVVNIIWHAFGAVIIHPYSHWVRIEFEVRLKGLDFWSTVNDTVIDNNELVISSCFISNFRNFAFFLCRDVSFISLAVSWIVPKSYFLEKMKIWFQVLVPSLLVFFFSYIRLPFLLTKPT